MVVHIWYMVWYEIIVFDIVIVIEMIITFRWVATVLKTQALNILLSVNMDCKRGLWTSVLLWTWTVNVDCAHLTYREHGRLWNFDLTSWPLLALRCISLVHKIPNSCLQRKIITKSQMVVCRKNSKKPRWMSLQIHFTKSQIINCKRLRHPYHTPIIQ